jgi:hypothetical protein
MEPSFRTGLVLIGLMVLVSLASIALFLIVVLSDPSQREAMLLGLLYLVVAGPLIWAALSISQRYRQ